VKKSVKWYVVLPVVVVAVVAVVMAVTTAMGRSPRDRPNPDSASEPPKDSETPLKAVKGTGTEITVVSEDGHTSYVVRAKESRAKVEESGLDYGTLKDVVGEFRRDGRVEWTYKAPTATVNKKSKTLLLSGGAVISGPNKVLVLEAKNIKYDQVQGRIEADGAVTVTSSAMVWGPLPKLWATPDLKKIATPGKFK